MSSGFWDKKDDPGLFGGDQSKGLWSKDHDSFLPGPGSDPFTGNSSIESMAKDGGIEWDEMENAYYKAFESRPDFNKPTYSRYSPYNQKGKYEPPEPVNTQPEMPNLEGTSKTIENEEDHEAAADGSGTGGSSTEPYREEEMQITNIRRGGHKRLRNNLFSINRYAKHNCKGRRIPDYSEVLNRLKAGGMGKKQANPEETDIPIEGDDSMLDDPPSPEELEQFHQKVEKERIRLEKLGPSKETLEARKATSDFFKFMYAGYGEVESVKTDYCSDDNVDEFKSIDGCNAGSISDYNDDDDDSR